MFFEQFVDEDLGCASYLVGDEGTRGAVVVDPAFAVEPYLESARRRGLRLVAVLETHTHADHVSGHGRLALEHGIPVRIHPAAEPEYPFEPLRDGETIDLGTTRITVIHTPGHRPEHCALAVADTSRSDEPWLVLTGDSLFVGDAARPDLSVEAREGAKGLYASLRRLLELPDSVEVYPGHVAGSLCGAAMSSKASTTVGFERRFNPMLGLAGVEDFVAASTAATSTPRPPNMERIVALNRGPFVGTPPPLTPVDAPEGLVVLDVRDADAFASGHVPGAVSVPLSSSGFGTKAAFVLDPADRVAIHAASPEEADRAAARLHSVGLFELAGRLDDPATPERVEPVELEELERLVEEDAVVLVDVREKDERDDGYIAGSVNVPYRLLRELGSDLAKGKTVVTICSSGTRAGIAASVLAAQGVGARPVLHGSVREWAESGHETVHFRRCGS
ncbi:MAG: MBL fold metallo-hydrolase [Thermoleophilia bacterium]|nr:MBL fold metallo-hydrolase [Thermoleophilia bacterium]